MADWLTPIIGLGGVILGAGISEYRRWREGKEQYRVLTFERRLKTHQEALVQVSRLYNSFSSYIDFTIRASDKLEMLETSIDKAEEWWSDNCLYLDEVTREKFSDLLIALRDFLITKDVGDLPYGLFDETRDAITNGIGVEHLPRIAQAHSQK
jgi:hypothetical protein